MTMVKSYLLLAIAVLLHAESALATQELTMESFGELKKSGKNGIVKFFQTWCGHCTRMKPDWDRLAEESHPSVFVADVNCGDEEELCQEVGVSGYPTIKVYRDGIEEDYEGARSFDALSEFVDSELAMKCDVNKMKESGCSEKAEKYALKWKAKSEAEVKKEAGRLSGMAGKSMTADLKTWLRERVALLKQLAPEDEEL